MSNSLKRAFPANSKVENDGLNQPQREAIVDLLHYCMFADNFVSLKEDKFVNTVAATLSWDRNISFESFEGGSIGKARKAKESASYRERFFQDVLARLATPAARGLALKLCKDLYHAGAAGAELEAQQLAVISKLLA